MTEAQRPTTTARATLPPAVGEFLIELSIAVHRYAMYPSGHPSLAPALDRVLGRLLAIFPGRDRLTIGVARDQLIIDQHATDPKHPVMSDLARRIHGHHLAALWFASGVLPSEIEGLLMALAADPERGVEPLGLRSREDIPTWPHVGFSELGYESLVFREDEEEEGDPSTSLWLDLARAVVPDSEEDGATDTSALADAIGRDEEYDAVVADYLRRLAQQMKGGKGAGTERVRQEVTRLIQKLDDDSLTRLVRMSGGTDAQADFVLDVNESFAVDAVVRMLETAARTGEQTISNSMTRLLSKLATHAERGPETMRKQADGALRENVEELIQGWRLGDPNPEHYTAILDAMAHTKSGYDGDDDSDLQITGARRIVEMALELDAYGITVERAVQQMLAEGEGRLLLDRVSTAAEGEVADRIWSLLATPSHLSEFLSGEDVDELVLGELVGRLEDRAIDPLLEVLTESDSRVVRRKVFDALTKIGTPVKERALARLEDERWYVLRNMLALLNALGAPPSGFDPAQYTWHPDHRVRRQAFSLAMKDDRHRQWALAEAFTGQDERLIRIALTEVDDRLPEALVPTVVSRIVQGDHPAEIRALGALALTGSTSVLARDALVELATGGPSLFGRIRIQPSAPDVIAGLTVLSRRWADNVDVKRIIEAAAEAKDDAIREAVSEKAEA